MPRSIPKEAHKVLCKQDPAFASLVARAAPFVVPEKSSVTPFEAIAQSILHQQLAGAAARTIVGRVKAALGDPLRPKVVLTAAPEVFRTAGVSGNKMKALVDLAQHVEAGKVPNDLGELDTMEDEAIIKAYTQVFGIGRWTVEMLLIFRLGRLDVLPVHDYAIRKGFSTLYGGELPSPKQVFAHGERWRPYRTVASWYLWRASEE